VPYIKSPGQGLTAHVTDVLPNVVEMGMGVGIEVKGKVCVQAKWPIRPELIARRMK